MLTLMLVCAFSPRVHSIPRGPHFNKLSVVADGRLNLLRKLYFDFVKVIFRLLAEVTVFIHNLTAGQISLQRNITAKAISLSKTISLQKQFPERETNSLTSPVFSGILALRVSRTVASQDEESPSITRQGAGEIPVKATSRKVQQRYTARFIV